MAAPDPAFAQAVSRHLKGLGAACDTRLAVEPRDHFAADLRQTASDLLATFTQSRRSHAQEERRRS